MRECLRHMGPPLKNRVRETWLGNEKAPSEPAFFSSLLRAPSCIMLTSLLPTARHICFTGVPSTPSILYVQSHFSHSPMRIRYEDMCPFYR